MVIKIEGKYNTATIHGEREMFDDSCIEQITEMVNHEALAGDDNVVIMSDAHKGAGAVIGFTMPLRNRIVPNVVGVDCGCGMLATNFGDVGDLDLARLDHKIRERVPTGFDVHNRSDYHMIDDFPWDDCRDKLRQFDDRTNYDFPDAEDVYTDSYFTELCEQVSYDQGRAINSMGTLGGGNHFIEVGRSVETDDLWVVTHSGSRGLGAQIAQYWQNMATNRMTKRKSIDEVPNDVRMYMNENWKPKADRIRKEFTGESIQRKFDAVSQAIQEYGPSSANRNTDLDFLEGNEATGYIIDMIFAQTYASESRRQMVESVAQAIGDVDGNPPGTFDSIESVHNYIDFEDATIRKGACRAHDGDRLVVPFNMQYGTIIAEGKGDPEWNNSSAHGAGRAMSRTEAKNRFDESDFADQTEGVYMSERPMDEIPGAYKSPKDVESALGGNVEVIDRIEPVLSIKAE